MKWKVLQVQEGASTPRRGWDMVKVSKVSWSLYAGLRRLRWSVHILRWLLARSPRKRNPWSPAPSGRCSVCRSASPSSDIAVEGRALQSFAADGRKLRFHLRFMANFHQALWVRPRRYVTHISYHWWYRICRIISWWSVRLPVPLPCSRQPRQLGSLHRTPWPCSTTVGAPHCCTRRIGANGAVARRGP